MITTQPHLDSQEIDVFARLEREHREAATLCTQIPGAGDGTARQRALFQKLKEHVLAHGSAEEETIYAVASRKLGDADILSRGAHEHAEVNALVRRLDSVDMRSPEWRTLFGELRDRLDAHVRWEEQEVLPHLKQILSRKEADVLLRHYRTKHDKLLLSLEHARA
jgi:hypothetical protein